MYYCNNVCETHDPHVYTQMESVDLLMWGYAEDHPICIPGMLVGLHVIIVVIDNCQ